jgi:hypothetical protein
MKMLLCDNGVLHHYRKSKFTNDPAERPENSCAAQVNIMAGMQGFSTQIPQNRPASSTLSGGAC